MKINIVQSNSHSFRLGENLDQISNALQTESAKKSLLTVFPANSLSGAPLSDLLEYADLHKEINKAMQDCVVLSEQYHAFIIGLPLFIQDRGLCSCLVFVHNGAIRAIVSKKKLDYKERKYFVRGEGFKTIQFHGEKLAIGFAEDIKDLYRLQEDKPDTIICCASAAFDYAQPYKTFYKIQKTVEELNIPLVYVNRIGGEASLLYAGGSMAFNAMGQLLIQMPYFEKHEEAVDLQCIDSGFIPTKPDQIALIHDALVMGIRDYFLKTGLKKAVLGLSGGIDSALVLVLAVHALGKENVRACLMPSAFSSPHSVTDAVALAENLGVAYELVSIKNLYDTANTTLKPLFLGKEFDSTEENLQARIRGMILMALSNKTGAAVLNSSNKSEIAMGYGTLYGDMCGALSVIGDLYKGQVYEMANWINRDREIIPLHIITKEPSAELRPGQKDSDSLPAYEILDEILDLYIQQGYSLSEIVKEGFDEPLVVEVIKKVQNNEFKRMQAPPVLRVSPAAFGVDRITSLV